MKNLSERVTNIFMISLKLNQQKCIILVIPVASERHGKAIKTIGWNSLKYNSDSMKKHHYKFKQKTANYSLMYYKWYYMIYKYHDDISSIKVRLLMNFVKLSSIEEGKMFAVAT